jgi:hypothetical protein
MASDIESGLSSSISGVLLGWLFKHLFLLFEHLFVEVFIVVVSNKCFLDILLVEKLHVLLNLFAILVLPLTVSIVSVKVVFVWWHEWRSKSLMKKIVPRKVS